MDGPHRGFAARRELLANGNGFGMGIFDSNDTNEPERQCERYGAFTTLRELEGHRARTRQGKAVVVYVPLGPAHGAVQPCARVDRSGLGGGGPVRVHGRELHAGIGLAVPRVPLLHHAAQQHRVAVVHRSGMRFRPARKQAGLACVWSTAHQSEPRLWSPAFSFRSSASL